jgi:hypothetical protein
VSSGIGLLRIDRLLIHVAYSNDFHIDVSHPPISTRYTNSDSIHITAASASQHKSAAAVSTIGGEGRGRVPTVVEDQNAEGKPH